MYIIIYKGFYQWETKWLAQSCFSKPPFEWSRLNARKRNTHTHRYTKEKNPSLHRKSWFKSGKP